MTVKEIKTILGEKYLSKSRGQSLLLDENIARKIAGLVSSENYGEVLEIGPGLGIITRHLLKRGFHVLAVEIDKDFCAYLETVDSEIICEDFLKVKIDSSFPEVALGALPFSVSIPILNKIKDNRKKIKEWIFVLQKEVAERITASPSTKPYSSLSIMFNILYDVEYEFDINPEAFFPRPDVISTVLKGVLKEESIIEVTEDFEKFLKDIFRFRRKTIKNNLFDYEINEGSIDSQRRAETLTKEEAVRLYRECKHNK
jgi:16S rRNA (adenine1518-N6/adenine1519-N6)-dimethyltransferase